MKGYKHLSTNDRIRIETMLNSGHTIKEIAEYLHVHVSTIYRERKRGAYVHRNSDWTEEVKYSSDMGQKWHDRAKENMGRTLKIGTDRQYAEWLEDIIVTKGYSPEAALLAAAKSGIPFKTKICVQTLYSYIDSGLFLKLTNKDLPEKGRRCKHKHKVRVQKRMSAGESIENRPHEIDDRNTFGHWEMDTVKGRKGVTKSCLLVLTERLTRQEIIAKLPDQGAASVVNVLDRLERKWGEMFLNIFRSITVDNGVEFSDYPGMERSLFGGRRTRIYYCHPYSSWERGSNENQNKLIRRHIPKGNDIDKRNPADIQHIENWINEYPRGIFNGKSAQELFKEAVNQAAKNF